MLPRHNDSNEILYALVKNQGGLDIKHLTLLSSRELAQEQTIALCLLVVSVVAHIEHDVRIGTEELHHDSNDRLTYFGIIGRSLVSKVRQVEPIGWNRRERRFLLEVHGIHDAVVRFERVLVAVLPDRIRATQEKAFWIKRVHTVSTL